MSEPKYEYVTKWVPVIYRQPVMETEGSSRQFLTTTQVPGEFLGNYPPLIFPPVMGTTGYQLPRWLPMMESNGESFGHGKSTVPIMETGESSYGKRVLTMESGSKPSHGKRLLPMETGESSDVKRFRAKETKVTNENDGRSKKSGSKGKQESDKVLHAQDSQIPILDELLKGPLGLNLKKTDSSLELFNMSLSQCINAATACVPPSPPPPPPKRGDHHIVEKLGNKEGSYRASNFPALRLRIGSWEVVAKSKGSLIVRIYFLKKQLVWEFLDNGRKKIEIEWSDITALKANCPDNGPETLTVELGKAPGFRKDINEGRFGPHKNFNPVHDFTDGEASKYRQQHVLEFSKGVLKPEYEKLIKGLSRLNQQRPDIILDSPKCSTEANSSPVELTRNYGVYDQIESAAAAATSPLSAAGLPSPLPFLGMDSCVKQMNANLQDAISYVDRDTIDDHIVDEYLNNLDDFQTASSDYESLGMSSSEGNNNLSRPGEDLDTIPMDKPVGSDRTYHEDWVLHSCDGEVVTTTMSTDKENYINNNVTNNIYGGFDQLLTPDLLRSDSCEELLYSLPRIASLPKLWPHDHQ